MRLYNVICGVWEKQSNPPEPHTHFDYHLIIGTLVFLILVVIPMSAAAYVFRQDIRRLVRNSRFFKQQQQQVEEGEEADEAAGERIPLRPLDPKLTGENEAKYFIFWKVNLTFIKHY